MQAPLVRASLTPRVWLSSCVLAGGLSALGACALAPPAPDEEVDSPLAEAPAEGPCEALPAAVAVGTAGAALDQRQDEAVRRVVLMGGGPEVDRASRLFVEAAAGGDVLVLRASGSTESYTSYFARELPVARAPASVTTLRLEDPTLAAHPAVLCRVRGAEALWLAGGDQAEYLVHWPPALKDEIAAAVARGVALGGTSAGAMAFAGLAFDAALGSITSSEALAAPGAAEVAVRPSPFSPRELASTVVDTHFVARDREGRLLAFLARGLEGRERVAGVGLDEEAALVIEGGAFLVLSEGTTASLYEASGPADLEGPLTLRGIRRAVLEDGARGAWPPDFAALEAGALEVVEGSIRER
jgi:cyanophycinase